MLFFTKNGIILVEKNKESVESEGFDMASNYTKIMYKDYEKIIEENEALKKELKETKEKLKQTEKIASTQPQLIKEVEELKSLLADALLTIKMLKSQNEALTEEVERLRSIINNDSNNSSIPPSQDKKSVKKSNEYNSRKKTTRKKGGQKGHHGRSMSHDDIQKILSTPGCEHIIKEVGKGENYTSKYVIDMKITPVVTEYRFYHSCPSGSFVSYGNNIKSIAVSLYGIGVMAFGRISSFIRDITDNVIKISAGTLYSFCSNFSDKAITEITKYEQYLQNQSFLYTDGTNITVNGDQQYIRNISNSHAVVYYPMERKNIETLNGIELLREYKGTLIHDHETALYHFGLRHAECNAHICRYLTKNSEDTGNGWSEEMKDFLENAYIRKKEAILEGKNSFSREELAEYTAIYDDIIKKAKIQNKGTKTKWAKQDEMSLIRRMEKYKENHLMFIYDFNIDYSNNVSERDLRKCKNRHKMSGGFRSENGCKMYCIILSIIETAKRRNQSGFSAIKSVFAN